MVDLPSLFIGPFVVRLSLTCPCNNIFPNSDTVTPHNLSSLKPSSKGSFYRGLEPEDTSGLGPFTDPGSAPEGQ